MVMYINVRIRAFIHALHLFIRSCARHCDADSVGRSASLPRARPPLLLLLPGGGGGGGRAVIRALRKAGEKREITPLLKERSSCRRVETLASNETLLRALINARLAFLGWRQAGQWIGRGRGWAEGGWKGGRMKVDGSGPRSGEWRAGEGGGQMGCDVAGCWGLMQLVIKVEIRKMARHLSCRWPC